MFNLFRIFVQKNKISFDIVAKNGNIAANDGNNVEATFDFRERIVRLVAFDDVASTLLLVWFMALVRPCQVHRHTGTIAVSGPLK